MKERSRTPALALLAIAIGGAVALLISEVGLRLIGFEFAMHPARVQFGWPDPVTIEDRYRLDRDLLWVPNDYYAKLESWSGRRPTVAHLGDSCTEFGRYDEYLDSLITQHSPGANYSFVNLGVGGWSTHQGLAQMRRDVVRFPPAVATIYYGWNDHWRSYGVADRDVGDFIRDYPAWMLALSRSRVVQLVMHARFSWYRRAGESSTDAPPRVSLSDFESNLVGIVRLARENGIVPVLMTAPTSHEVGSEPAYLVPRWLLDLDRLVPLHREYVEVVREVSRSHDVLLIDLYAEFASLEPEDRDALFNEDGIHLNEGGNRRIAEIMYDYLTAFDLLGQVLDEAGS